CSTPVVENRLTLIMVCGRWPVGGSDRGEVHRSSCHPDHDCTTSGSRPRFPADVNEDPSGTGEEGSSWEEVAGVAPATRGDQRLSSLSMSEHFSPTAIVVMFGLTVTRNGITDASATRSPCTPLTRRRASSGLLRSSSAPIATVHAGW